MPIDYTRYPDDWAERRERILQRAGHCCEHCGVQEYSIGWRDDEGAFHLVQVYDTYALARQEAQVQTVITGRHHITIRITLAHLDHDEWNHDVTDDRLAALCEYCHLEYDRHDNLMRKRYGQEYKRNQLPLF